MLSLFVAIALVFGLAYKAEASDLLFEQLPATATTTLSTNATNYGMRFNGINPPNWVVDRVGIYVQAITGTPGTWNVEFRNAAGSMIATTSTQTITTGWNYFDYPSGAELQDFGNDMRFRMIRVTGTALITVLTTSFATAPPTQNYRAIFNGGSPDSYPTVRVYGINLDDPIPGGTQTRIVSQDSPTNGETTASEVVSFQFDYFNNDTDELPVIYAGIDVKDMTAGYEYAPVEQDIIISGIGSFSTLLNLEENHLHLWRPYLRNASSTRIVYGQWYSFDVVGPSAPFESFIDPETGLPINASSTSFWDFLNVPNLLKTKAPTGYIYQIGTIISETNDISATTTPTLTLDFVTASSSITALQNVEVFSYDIVTELIPPSVIVILRTLMVAVLYIALAMGIIHHSHNMFS